MEQYPFDVTPSAWIILLFTVGISFYTLSINRNLYGKLLLHPFSIVHRNQWHQALTSGFLHADYGHLIFNMLTFYFFAFQLEATLGTEKFLLLYLISMVVSDIPSIIRHKDDIGYYSVGASGAISGVIFSFILFNPTAKMSLLLFPIGIPSPIFGLLYLAYCFYAARKSNDRINHEAHFWGAAAGIIITIIMVPGILNHFIAEIFGK